MQIMQITQDTSSVARRFPSAYWHDAIAENAPAVPAYADATGFFLAETHFQRVTQGPKFACGRVSPGAARLGRARRRILHGDCLGKSGHFPDFRFPDFPKTVGIVAL